MAMTEKEIAEYEAEIAEYEAKLAKEREAKNARIAAAKAATEAAAAKAKVPPGRPMAKEEIVAYEREVAKMRKNKPPKRTDLPEITGSFGKEI